MCLLSAEPHDPYQGWGTYLLSRAAWIVHYRWWAAKSLILS